MNLASVEQMRRRRRAKLNGIAFLVCCGWHDELSRCWCLSVGLVYRSVSTCIVPLCRDTMTSRKGTVNLIVG